MSNDAPKSETLIPATKRVGLGVSLQEGRTQGLILHLEGEGRHKERLTVLDLSQGDPRSFLARKLNGRKKSLTSTKVARLKVNRSSPEIIKDAIV